MPPHLTLSETYTYQQMFDRQGDINPNTIRATRERDGHVIFITAPVPGRQPSVEWAQYQAWLEAGNTPDPPDPRPGAARGAPRVELPEPMDPAIKQYIDDQIDQLKGG